jgi:RNA polymerase sigma-70 factor (ECF subfamily)
MGTELLEIAGCRGIAAERKVRSRTTEPGCADAAPDHQLLARHLFGDRRAFELLVNRYRPDLVTFLTRLMGDAAAAEDVAQETLFRLHRSADKFESSKGLRPWLFSIAANAARDHYRHRARRPAASLQAPARSDGSESQTLASLQAAPTEAPEARIERAELQDRVRRAVDRMPLHLREILLLSYFQRLSYNQISQSLQIPLGTVKSRLHSAVAHFASRWGPNQ